MSEAVREDGRAPAERALAELQRELDHRTGQLDALFEHNPDLGLRLSPAGRIRAANRAALRALGYRLEQLCGAHVWRGVAAGSRAPLRAALRQLSETGGFDNLEIQVRRADGQLLDAIVHAELERDAAGLVVGIRLALRDITSRNALHRQLLQADRLAATGRLAAGVAHEINNPLQAILLFLTVVEAELPPDFAERESWERIKEAVGRIRQIVADLLNLHRGADGDETTVDINRLVEEALGLVHASLRSQAVRLNKDLAPDLPPVRSIGRHVYQIVLNLLLNALTAMPHGGVLTVRTRSAGVAGSVEIDISDTGPGIPERLLPHIFDPFFSAGTGTGTGLGLSVTYSLVREHAGKIHVDSMPGRGTTFRVQLPRGPSPAAAAPPEPRLMARGGAPT